MNHRVLALATLLAAACASTPELETKKGGVPAARATPVQESTEVDLEALGDAAPDVYFLHVFTTSYDCYQGHDGRWEGKPTQERFNRRLVTVSICDGADFEAMIPNYYSPEVHIKGRVEVEGQMVTGALDLFVQDVDLASGQTQVEPFRLETLVPFEGDPNFFFAISDDSDPFSWDSELPRDEETVRRRKRRTVRFIGQR